MFIRSNECSNAAKFVWALIVLYALKFLCNIYRVQMALGCSIFNFSYFNAL